MPRATAPRPATAAPRQRCVLLLRAINVGRRQLPMAALRALAEQLGFGAPHTYLASGNLVAELPQPAADAARQLEAAITEHFGFHSDAIVRSAVQWPAYLVDPPAAVATAPQRVMLLLANRAPAAQALDQLRERAAPGEHIQPAGPDGLWIHYAEGVASSRLTPAFIDRCVGAPATARNWRTVQALAGLLGGA